MKKIVMLSLAGVLAATAVAAQQPQPRPEPAPQPAPGAAPARPAGSSFFSTPGYLPRGTTPDSLMLNPAPPVSGSPAEARDVAAAEAALKVQGTPRWELAKRDADFMSPAGTGVFSCAAGFAIGAQTTPKLEALLRRVSRDLAGATGATKRKYMRARPFIANGKPICTPDQERVLRSDGSYPSGHSALGWGWGLILAQAVPDRAAQLVARGRAYGDSRRICNVHWLSDVEEGRIVGSAVVARLNSDPAFQADLAAARAEVAALAERNPGQSCAAEAEALAL